MATFDKSAAAFPGRDRQVFLLSCSASPLPAVALEQMVAAAHAQAESGGLVFGSYNETLDRFHRTAAPLFGTDADNVSFQRNTTEALSLIAGGYPFRPGDEVISYVHEYPANHYPWRNLVRRGVSLVELPNVPYAGDAAAGDAAADAGAADAGADGRPYAFSLDDLQQRITRRTRVVALSTVQFTSGFAVSIESLAEICRAHGIDLVLDAAQSLGAVPLRPEEHGVAAVAASGWKWLLGPIGSGVMYTSPELRDKLEHVAVGAETMLQGFDYLDHSWAPHRSAKRFEYATASPALVAALEASIAGIHLRYGVEAIGAEILRLQDLLIDALDPALFIVPRRPAVNRSGILGVVPRRGTPEDLVARLLVRGFVASARGGYVRIAPHFFITDEEIARLAGAMNELG
ncbi:MAG TPA: aminotransferase class V-fold PLP-dependent enzyme [Candidatus Limnocylindrales bacterium]|nr:aminotransferase class V-fold PLP-dependent enzyme [Candidatus Limnocylindrales bacterium]